MTAHHRLPDTRAYPADPVKNELLLYAGQLLADSGKAQARLAHESLHNSMVAMLRQGHYLGLSVALAMAPDADHYRLLWHKLTEVLAAQNTQEVAWLAWPVVVVAGSEHAVTLPQTVPAAAITELLSRRSGAEALAEAQWLPGLFSAADLTAVRADRWFAAKQSMVAAADFAAGLTALPPQIEAGQSVHVYYALAYGPARLQSVAGLRLDEAALPLMQVWQAHLAVPGITLFANPLPPLPPLAALHEGAALRLRMAGDVFAANAIRAVRLQSPRVGVVIAAQEGGRLLFGFNAAEGAFEMAQQVFAWPLSPMDNMDIVVQNWIDLLAECQVEHIRLLHEALPEGAELPSYAEARHRLGHNPLFAESH